MKYSGMKFIDVKFILIGVLKELIKVEGKNEVNFLNYVKNKKLFLY